jgi:ligand-binding sensor domain-containing protein
MFDIKRISKIILFGVLFLSAFFSNNYICAQNQQFSFEHLSVAEGLSQSTVFAIEQDSKGFMWFGTRTGGLNKYDGYTFKVYKNNSDDPYSISGNEILNIFEDSKGRIWIGTRNFGINRFDYKTERFYHYLNIKTFDNNPEFRTVTSFIEDYKGRIWTSTLGGLCLYDEEKDEFVQCLNSQTNDAYPSISSLCRVRDSLICLGSSVGAFLLNTNSHKVVKHFTYNENDLSSINSNNVTQVLYDSKGRLWLGTRRNGLNRLNNLSSNSFTRIEHDITNSSSLIYDVIRALYEDKNGVIWIGTSLGLDQLLVKEQGELNPKFIHHQNDVNDPKSLAQNVLFSFFQDSWGNYWIGTWSSGVDYLNIYSKRIDHFRNNKDELVSLGDDNVTCFAENNLGIWIGTDGGGLSLFDRKENKFVQHISKEDKTGIIRSNKIRSVFADEDSSIWIGTFEGLVQYHPKTGRSELVFGNHVINYIIKGIGDELWFGGTNGLIKFNKRDRTYKEYIKNNDDTTALAGSNINILYADKNKDIWIGTNNGLHLYNRKQDNFIWYQYSPISNTSLSNDNVVTITNDNNGALWIGTYDGLNKFNPETQSFIRYSENNGLPDNVVNGIITDKHNKLWLSTNKGIVTFYLKNESGKEVPVVRLYTKVDGLQGEEFIRHSYLKTKNGEFLFGGTNGFNIFHPDSIRDNPQIPDIVFTELRLFNKPVRVNDETNLLSEHITLTKKITLSYKQSVVSFSFAALNYASPEKNQFAYIMEGFEKDWNYVGNKHEATYTNLPAGDYVFRVKASNNDGIWNEKGTSIDIKIRPPWYKTYLFYLITLLTISFAIYRFIKARENQLKKDRERLQNELAEGKEETRKQRLQVEKQAEDLRIKEENERAMKWHNVGFIKLSNIISENRHDLTLLANNIIFEMAQYFEASMGAIYILKEQNLELMGGYALDQNRVKNMIVEIGEGLVGTCYNEKKIMKIDNLPEKYATLSSGLGDVELPHLVLIPIIYNESVEGVIELISHLEISKEKFTLIESVSGTLGAALINKKSNQQIQKMLDESNEQKELLSAHEEELRQNIEELSATQEESAKREESLNKKISDLENKLREASN